VKLSRAPGELSTVRPPYRLGTGRIPPGQPSQRTHRRDGAVTPSGPHRGRHSSGVLGAAPRHPIRT